MTTDQAAATGEAAAEAIYRLADQFELEAASYRRLLGKSATRCATADAIAHCASIARQFAYQVERRGMAHAARRLPPVPVIDLDGAVRAAMIAIFRCWNGREPTQRDLLGMAFDERAVRTGLVAAWPHVRRLQQSGEGETP